MDPMDEMLMIRPPAGAAESRWSADADKKKTDSTFVEKVFLASAACDMSDGTVHSHALGHIEPCVYFSSVHLPSIPRLYSPRPVPAPVMRTSRPFTENRSFMES